MPVKRDISPLTRRVVMPLEQDSRLSGRAGGMEKLEGARGQGCQVRCRRIAPALHGEVI
jgi:hypothetical protein